MKTVIKYKLYCLILVLQLLHGNCYSQINKIDSVKRILKTSVNDTIKVLLMRELSIQYKTIGDYEQSMKFIVQAEDLLRLLLSKPATEIPNFEYLKNQLAHTYIDKGTIFANKGDYPKSLQNHYLALKFFEEIRFSNGIADAYIGIGNVYYFQSEFEKAINFYTKSYNIYKQQNDISGMASVLGNIGIINKLQKNYAFAIKNYNQALALFIKSDNKRGMAEELNNIAGVFYEEGDYTKCLEYCNKSLEMKKEIGNKQGIANSLGNIGELYAQQKKYTLGERYLKEALQMSIEMSDLEGVSGLNQSLSELYEIKNNYPLALYHYKESIKARDSLFNEENTRNTVQSEMKYVFEKQEASAKLEQEKKEVIANIESKKQQAIIWSACGILILVFIFTVFVYRSYLQKQKASEAITKQKEIIEEKQKEILDSIHYAKRIQIALLTSEKYIDRNLNKLIK